LASGADTEKSAHCPYVGEFAAGPEGGGAFTTPWYEDFIDGPLVEVFREAILKNEESGVWERSFSIWFYNDIGLSSKPALWLRS